MQAYILKQKKTITIISGILIVMGLFAHFLWNNEPIYTTSFIIASLIGVAPIAIQAYQAVKVKVISIDVLVTIAVLGAFAIKSYDESAIVTFLFLFGALIEQYTLNQTRSAIKELTELAPDTAFLQVANGIFEEIDIDELEKGDILLVKTGGKVPVDGQVIWGQGLINEAAITGEPLPISKVTGASVYAGTILENGTIHIRAEKVGEDTTFGKIIELVEEAQDSKSEAERFIDRFSTYYTPFVLLLAILVGLVTRNIDLAITILVLGCPGALVIGVPVSNVAGIGNGARHGVLLKGSEVIQQFNKVDTFVFDKTGTLTMGKPEVSDVRTYGNADEVKEAQIYLYSMESQSDHPLAKAILTSFEQMTPLQIEHAQVIKGGGIVGQYKDKIIRVGNPELMRQAGLAISNQVAQDIAHFEKAGNSLVLLAINHQIKLLYGIRDQIRPGVKEDLRQLKALGAKQLILLSGDNQATVDTVVADLDLDAAYGNMLPEDKANYIQQLQSQGHTVAFIGDGINDSPSLALASVGIAMGNGTDVAIETSDVVLVNSQINRLPHAYGLAKQTALNMKENILIAIGVVLILLASLLFSSWMSMSIGMLAHETSILVVILNGMRLLRYRIKR